MKIVIMEKLKVIVATIDVETGCLFGEINAVIAYLSKVRDKYKNGEYIEVNEEWSGYEDNYFQINVTREETDEECLKREDEEKKVLMKELEKQVKLKKEQLRKEEIKEQIK